MLELAEQCLALGGKRVYYEEQEGKSLLILIIKLKVSARQQDRSLHQKPMRVITSYNVCVLIILLKNPSQVIEPLYTLSLHTC